MRSRVVLSRLLLLLRRWTIKCRRPKGRLLLISSLLSPSFHLLTLTIVSPLLIIRPSCCMSIICIKMVLLLRVEIVRYIIDVVSFSRRSILMIILMPSMVLCSMCSILCKSARIATRHGALRNRCVMFGVRSHGLVINIIDVGIICLLLNGIAKGLTQNSLRLLLLLFDSVLRGRGVVFDG